MKFVTLLLVTILPLVSCKTREFGDNSAANVESAVGGVMFGAEYPAVIAVNGSFVDGHTSGGVIGVTYMMGGKPYAMAYHTNVFKSANVFELTTRLSPYDAIGGRMISRSQADYSMPTGRIQIVRMDLKTEESNVDGRGMYKHTYGQATVPVLPGAKGLNGFQFYLETNKGERVTTGKTIVRLVQNADAVIAFTGDGKVSVMGALRPNSTVEIRYDTHRMKRIANLPNLPIDVGTRFDSGKEIYYSVTAHTSEVPQMHEGVPVLLYIPQESHQLSLWFRGNAGAQPSWDSNNSQNYVFKF